MKIFLLIISVLIQITCWQHLVSAQPRLVVGIMVDGLQQKHIELLADRFNAAGIRKLTEQGVALPRISANIVSAGNVSDIATLTSGTVPYYHGVISNQVYNRDADTVESVFYDGSSSGIETEMKLSAKNFRMTNFVDELMMFNRGKSKSYAVGLHAEDVIALGGHAANGVAWLDDVSMKWCSTTYYNEGMPLQALDMNVNGSFHRYLDRVWQPLYPLTTYLTASDEKKTRPFEYRNTAFKKNNGLVTILKNTPSANSLVAELALRIFQEQELGTDQYADALMLQFTVRTPNETEFSLQSVEKEDMYLRLDDELQFLIQKIENKIGTDKVLFMLFGNQTNAYGPEELKSYNIHAGYFNANRAMALLNSYLMAIYGQEKWISGYYGRHIYFNKRLIEEKNIDFKKMQALAIDFMLEFEGVQAAYSFSQIMCIGTDPDAEMAKIRNSTHKNSAGDVILTWMPGWLEVDDRDNPIGESTALIAYMPIWLYGAKMPRKIIKKQYQITDIAPTVSDILNIPYTNANIGQAIEIRE